MEALRGAEPEEIASLKSFNRVLADRILLALNEGSMDEDDDSEDS